MCQPPGDLPAHLLAVYQSYAGGVIVSYDSVICNVIISAHLLAVYQPSDDLSAHLPAVYQPPDDLSAHLLAVCQPPENFTNHLLAMYQLSTGGVPMSYNHMMICIIWRCDFVVR